jgi:hypothetical protein
MYFQKIYKAVYYKRKTGIEISMFVLFFYPPLKIRI